MAHAPHRCPTCGTSLEGNMGLSIDLKSSTLLLNETAVSLPPRMAMLLAAVWSKYPAAADQDFLQKKVFLDKVPADPTKYIHVLVHGLRKLIADQPIEILGHRGGYTIQFKKVAQ